MYKKEELVTKNMHNIIRDARDSKHYTRDYISERVEITTRHLTAIENGEKRPSIECFVRLMRAMGVSADIVAYPELAQEDPEFDQLVRLLRTCDERDRKVIKAMVEALIESRKSE
ncbi:MAG: helix-turn-helix transcriptional regulator [Oscillospiraceae bacterium]|nr:helix-turn-helix transcriptional regulator [Oscillospiraceae bacterium]